eukprot:Awhi_evm1s14737
MKPPKGIELITDIDPDELWRLLKAIYGTKQAGRNWFELLGRKLMEQGFTRCKSEPCVYFKQLKDGTYVIVGTYVDDIINIQYEFLGEINHFVGWGVSVHQDGYYLNQTGYIESILEEYNMIEAKIKRVPMDRLPDANDDHFDGPYQQLVGSLLYLSCGSRPDIQFTVNACSRLNKNPTKDGWKCLKDILKYLKGTKNLGLYFGKSNSLNINIYVDADYATDVLTRRSRTGLVILINGTPILWDSSMQKSTALSTAEAEYMALAEGAKTAK